MERTPTFTMLCVCHDDIVRGLLPPDVYPEGFKHQRYTLLSDWAYDQLVAHTLADAEAALA